MIRISAKKIYFSGAFFLALPLLIWCIGWLKPLFAVLAVFLLIAGLFMVWKKADKEFLKTEDITIPFALIIALVLVVLLWCILGGQGGLWYQSSDWNARNAVFRDLITYDWPVVYENGNALCYYFGFWLVPALFGKVCLVCGLGAGIAWSVANIALLFWTACGVFLAAVLLLQLVKRSDVKTVCLVVALLIFFSGMDIVGLLLTGDASQIEQRLTQKVHIEWWASIYQFSSFTTQLFWVFNQAIPAWIATLLVLSTKRVDNDIFIGALSAFLCPLPTMGLLFIGVAKLVGEIRVEGGWNTLRSIASLQNLVALIPLLFVIMFLFLSQRASLTSAAPGESVALFHTYIGGFTLKHVARLCLFFFLECGFLLLLLLPSERKNPYWWGALILLMVANVVRLGPSPDFAMRASIPGLMVLLVMVAKHLTAWDFRTYYQWIREKCRKPVDSATVRARSRLIGVVVVGCLVIGAVTPLVEIARGPVKMVEAQQIPMLNDEIRTFANTDSENFLTLDYDDSFFAMTIGR